MHYSIKIYNYLNVLFIFQIRHIVCFLIFCTPYCLYTCTPLAVIEMLTFVWFIDYYSVETQAQWDDAFEVRIGTFFLLLIIIPIKIYSVADSRRVRGVQTDPTPSVASNVFLRTYLHESINWLYSTVACSNNNQAQLHTCASVPCWSPNVCLDLELLRDIQFRLPASYNNNYVCIYVPKAGVLTKKFSGALGVPLAEPPFLNF